MNILLTGGAGYIGSHTFIELVKRGHKVFIYDNFSNSKKLVLERLQKITGAEINFIQNDIKNTEVLKNLLINNSCDAVIHFAGLKSVSESIKNPILYFENNISGTLSLLRAMREAKVKTLIYSSSATVYDGSGLCFLKEDDKLLTNNPYGQSKLLTENILRNLIKYDDNWEIGILRYFNPVGAHKSGLIGEDPNGQPNNLMPNITQVAVGIQKELQIWGDDFPTKDGTGIRDYIHVSDLAVGHIKTLENLKEKKYLLLNLGTGKGSSVLDVIKTFEKISGKQIPIKISARREGDKAIICADPKKALKLINWKAELNLINMCEDSWRWQRMNPDGYV